MRKIIPLLAAVFLAAALFSACAQADGISSLPLGRSTGGILFTPGGGGYLNFELGGCLSGATDCTVGNVSGVINGEPWAYSLSQTSGFGDISASGQWQFFGTDTTFQLIDTDSSLSQVNGTISWTDAESSGANPKGFDELIGTVTYTSVGVFATLFGSGSATFTLDLDPITCAPATSPCNLSAIASSDPIDGYSAIGSSSSGGPSPTPEPGTLLLLASGLLGFAPFVRRKLARA